MHIAHGKFFQACKCTDPKGSVDRFRGVCACVWTQDGPSVAIALHLRCSDTDSGFSCCFAKSSPLRKCQHFVQFQRSPQMQVSMPKGSMHSFSSCFASVIPMPATYEIYLGWEEENCLWYLRKHGWHWLFCSVGQRNLTVNNGDGQRWKLNGDLSFVIAEMRNSDTLLWNSTETTLNSTMRY